MMQQAIENAHVRASASWYRPAHVHPFSTSSGSTRADLVMRPGI